MIEVMQGNLLCFLVALVLSGVIGFFIYRKGKDNG